MKRKQLDFLGIRNHARSAMRLRLNLKAKVVCGFQFAYKHSQGFKLQSPTEFMPGS